MSRKMDGWLDGWMDGWSSIKTPLKAQTIERRRLQRQCRVIFPGKARNDKKRM